MKNFLKFPVVLFVIVTSFSAFAGANRFPKGPNLTETPGKLCTSPTEYRYPEHVAYCERDVDTYTKNAIIQKYDTVLGYEIRTMKRLDFKIDHFIPLCAGGANSEENLWPQHKSVYAITDPLEPVLCEKMAQGRLTQADAVKMITQAKLNLDQAPAIFKKLRSL